MLAETFFEIPWLSVSFKTNYIIFYYIVQDKVGILRQIWPAAFFNLSGTYMKVAFITYDY